MKNLPVGLVFGAFVLMTSPATAEPVVVQFELRHVPEGFPPVSQLPNQAVTFRYDTDAPNVPEEVERWEDQGHVKSAYEMEIQWYPDEPFVSTFMYFSEFPGDARVIFIAEPDPPISFFDLEAESTIDTPPLRLFDHVREVQIGLFGPTPVYQFIRQTPMFVIDPETVQYIPEPSAAVLISIGLLGLFAICRPKPHEGLRRFPRRWVCPA